MCRATPVTWKEAVEFGEQYISRCGIHFACGAPSSVCDQRYGSCDLGRYPAREGAGAPAWVTRYPVYAFTLGEEDSTSYFPLGVRIVHEKWRRLHLRQRCHVPRSKYCKRGDLSATATLVGDGRGKRSCTFSIHCVI